MAGLPLQPRDGCLFLFCFDLFDYRADRRVVLVQHPAHPLVKHAEAQVAAGLASGQSVGGMAEATGCPNDAIYWRLKQIYQKQDVSGQVDLVRLVLSAAELG